MSGCSKKRVVEPETCRRLCTCGREHPVVETEYHIGPEAFEYLAEDCRETAPGPVLLLDDENTHRAAGRAIAEIFERETVPHQVLTLGDGIHATEELAETVYEKSRGYGLVVAVGSGTINDLAKYASGKRKHPYWAVPTAPSMNGFTSATAAINVAGVKRTLPNPPPRFMYIHPDVVRNAPRNLIQAGYCDVMAKSVSDVDWQIESLLFSGSYCRLPSAIVSESEGDYIDLPDRIGAGDSEAVMGLLTGLLVSGAAMTLAGSSAPASGGEHLVSHFFDMREAVTGRPAELHGLQVALGIILSASCYRILADLEREDLKNRAQTSFQEDADRIPAVWGDLAPTVEKFFFKKREQILQMDERLPREWSRVKGLCRDVRPPDFYADRMRRTGFPLTLEAMNLRPDEFRLAALNARTIRERITVLDLAAQAGVLEAAVEEVITLLQ